MNPKQQEILNSSKLFISRNIHFNDQLIEKLSSLLTQPEMEMLESKTNQSAKVTFLVDRLRSKGNAAYYNFLLALERSEDIHNSDCATFIRRRETQLALDDIKSTAKIEIYQIKDRRKGVFIINTLQFDLTELEGYFTRKDFRVTVLTQERCGTDLVDKIVEFFDPKDDPYHLFGLICISEGTAEKTTENDRGVKQTVKEKLVFRREPPGEALVLLRERVLFRFHLEKYKGLPKFAVFITRLCDYDKDVTVTERRGTPDSYEGFTNSLIVDFKYIPQNQLPNDPARDRDGQVFLQKWIGILRDDEKMDLVQSVCNANSALKEGQPPGDTSMPMASILGHFSKRLVFADARTPKKA